MCNFCCQCSVISCALSAVQTHHAFAFDDYLYHVRLAGKQLAERLATGGVTSLRDLAALDARRIEAITQRNYPFGKRDGTWSRTIISLGKASGRIMDGYIETALCTFLVVTVTTIQCKVLDILSLASLKAGSKSRLYNRNNT